MNKYMNKYKAKNYINIIMNMDNVQMIVTLQK